MDASQALTLPSGDRGEVIVEVDLLTVLVHRQLDRPSRRAILALDDVDERSVGSGVQR